MLIAGGIVIAFCIFLVFSYWYKAKVAAAQEGTPAEEGRGATRGAARQGRERSFLRPSDGAP